MDRVREHTLHRLRRRISWVFVNEDVVVDGHCIADGHLRTRTVWVFIVVADSCLGILVLVLVVVFLHHLFHLLLQTPTTRRQTLQE